MLNYFEYYVGLLPNLRAVQDLWAVEEALLQSEPFYAGYALEIWRRIAITLTERRDTERLYESSVRFLTYLQKTAKKRTITKEAVDVLEAYCVGLHNAEEVEKYSRLLEQCSEFAKELRELPEIGEFCCSNYANLQHLKLYEDRKADLQPEWERIAELLRQWEYPENLCRLSLATAQEAIRYLVKKQDLSGLQYLQSLTHTIYGKTNLCEAAEAESLCIANLVAFRKKVDSKQYEIIQQYQKEFSQSKAIQMSYISVSDLFYAQTADYKKVPDAVLRLAKEWAERYPEDIEFPEGYFRLLLSGLFYARAHDLRNEQRRLFREMKRIAENTDDSEYEERSQMLETVHSLQALYGYR